jgi:hypothetical protein
MTRLMTILALSCAFFTTIQAQKTDETETLRRIYDQTTIMPLNTGFMKNGVITKNELFKNALKKELAQTPEALQRFKKGTLQNWGAGGLFILGSASITVSAFGISQAQYWDERVAVLSTLVAGQSLLILGSNKLNQSTTNIQNAVWLHNRSEILKMASKNPSLDVAKVADLYDKNTIQFASNGYYQNGQYQNFGFLNKNLHTLMHNNSLAMAQLKKARTNKIIATGLNIAGVVAMIAAPVSRNTSNLPSGWFWGGYGAAVASSFISGQSNNQLARAAWFYNRDAFLGKN